MDTKLKKQKTKKKRKEKNGARERTNAVDK